MRSPILRVMRAASVEFLPALAAPDSTVLRYVMVDVSAAVQLAPEATLSTREAIEAYVRAPLAKYGARLGVLAFDTAPNLPMHTPMLARSQATEARLPRSEAREPALYAAAQLEALSDDHCGALDGSPLLQWQWQSLLFVPTLLREMGASPSWPPLGLIIDSVVERSSTPGYYVGNAKCEMGMMNRPSVNEATKALDGDVGALYGRLLVRTLVGGRDYRRLHLSADGKTRRSLDKPPRTQPPQSLPHPPAVSLCKIMRNIAALALETAGGAPVQSSQIVVVSARADAMLYILHFLESLETDLGCSAARIGWLYMVLPGDVVVDVVAAAQQLKSYAEAWGLRSLTFLLLYLSLADTSDYLADALWYSLPRAPGPDHMDIDIDIDDDDDDEARPHTCFDSAGVPTAVNSADNARMLLDWLGRAHRLLLRVSDVVSYRALLDRAPALAAVLVPEKHWLSYVRRALFECNVLYRRAWQQDGYAFWSDSFTIAHEGGQSQREAVDPHDIATVVRNTTGMRYELVRRKNDKILLARYLITASAPLPRPPPMRRGHAHPGARWYDQ
jgi:hypothetical protein